MKHNTLSWKLSVTGQREKGRGWLLARPACDRRPMGPAPRLQQDLIQAQPHGLGGDSERWCEKVLKTPRVPRACSSGRRAEDSGGLTSTREPERTGQGETPEPSDLAALSAVPPSAISILGSQTLSVLWSFLQGVPPNTTSNPAPPLTAHHRPKNCSC